MIASIVAKPAFSASLLKSNGSLSTSNSTTRPQIASSSLRSHRVNSSGGGGGLSLLSEALGSSSSSSSSSSSGNSNNNNNNNTLMRERPVTLASSRRTRASSDESNAGELLVQRREEVKKLYEASPTTGRPSIGPGSKGFSIKRTDAWSSVSSENLRELWDAVAPSVGQSLTPSAKPAFIAATKKAAAADVAKSMQQVQQQTILEPSSNSLQSNDLEHLSPESIVKSVFPEFDPTQSIQRSLNEASTILSLSGKSAPLGNTSLISIKELTSSAVSMQPEQAKVVLSSSSSSSSSSALYKLAFGNNKGEKRRNDDDLDDDLESYEVS